MRFAAIQGEALFKRDPRTRSLVTIPKVALQTMKDSLYLDAILDTGATHCVVPPSVAKLLGFLEHNRLDVIETKVVGGGKKNMDVHAMEYVTAGTSKVHRVEFLVGDVAMGLNLNMLLGLTFIKRFERMTVDFPDNRVLFRGGI